tara:strand:+ start:67 stop:339 length:273 start_codon:yes stop_codon:yes gene_type:complete
MLSAFFGLAFGALGEYVLLQLGRFERKGTEQCWNEVPVIHVVLYACGVLIAAKCITGLGLTLSLFWLLTAAGLGFYWRPLADAWFDWKNP